jgi:hypothetical protein
LALHIRSFIRLGEKIALEQLLCHLVGDYLLQNDWMASNKTKDMSVAAIHGATYFLPFFLITNSFWALIVILITHIIIDHYSLAREFNKLKNDCWTFNGFPLDRPIWLTTWVIIIMDNTMHLLINYFALRYL